MLITRSLLGRHVPITLVQITHPSKILILILCLVIKSVRKTLPSAALKKWTLDSKAEDGRIVGFIKVFCALVSMKAMALIGMSYLEERMWTSIFGSGGVGSINLWIWEFWNFFYLHDRKMFFRTRGICFTIVVIICVFKSKNSGGIWLILFIIPWFNVFIIC